VSAEDERLALYSRLVLEANARFNLTGARTEAEFAPHVADSLTLLPYIQGPYLDIGSGAGLPGIPVALATGAETLLLEATHKKAKFLKETTQALGLNVRVVAARAEDAGRDPQWRERFQSATIRAVASASAAESSAGAPGAIPRPAPLVNADPGGSRAENPVTAAAAQAARPAAVGADARGASLAAADGGGGGAENNAPASLPAVAPRFPDGGGGDPAALPALTAVPAGGGGARATLDAESAGLATWFQPLGSAGVRHALEDLAAQATAPGGWFAWLLSRLRLAAPWLAALVGVGTVYEIRRRRRRSSREPGQAANAASR